jgi:hypothetical protein
MPFSNSSFPNMALVTQTFNADALVDVADSVQAQLKKLELNGKVRPGQTVAVTAGSRGIREIDTILTAVCGFFREMGASPFLFPAMGSHGGATAEGQTAVLAAMGVTEEIAPIHSSMDTIALGETPEGIPVVTDALASKADHIVVVGRVKSHTKFKGRLESGLFKMMGIGMGKHRGAELMHRMAVIHSFPTVVRSVGHHVLNHLPILCGLGIVENAHGHTHTLRALSPDQMERGEEELLRLSKELAPGIPFDDIDLLIVDEIGKDVSGTGMDTNVTGRNRDILGDFTTTPRVKRIFVRDLTPASAGNALGIGFADFTTDRLVAKMDYKKTVTNALTGISPEKAAVPIHFPTDRETINTALDSLGPWTPETVRVVRIKNTLYLEELYLSPALLSSLPPNVSSLGNPEPMRFGPVGNMEPFSKSR